MAKAAKERKAAERVRKRAAGLVPVEVWIHPSNREKLNKIAGKMERATPSASRQG